MIVRLLNEGQYRVSEELLGELNKLDDRAADALNRDDEEELRYELEQLAELVRSRGERLDDSDLSASDLILPPSDLSLDEARELFEREGLIPDLVE